MIFELWLHLTPVSGSRFILPTDTTWPQRWGPKKDFQDLITLAQQFAEDHRITHSGPVLRFNSDHPRAAAVMTAVEQLCEQHQLLLDRRSTIVEQWDSAWDASAWYRLSPREDAPHDLQLDQVPDGRHLLGGRIPVVSYEIKSLAERLGWTGLGFEPIEPTQQFWCRPWYRLHAAQPMGRGIDHPWIEPSLLRQDPHGFPALDLVHRRGQSHAKLSQLRLEEVSKAHILARFIALLEDPDNTRFSSPESFLSSALPARDAAYLWHRGLMQKPGHPWGPRQQERDVCVRSHVREALIQADLAHETDFQPLRVRDELPAGSEPLDARADPVPPPNFTESELRDLPPSRTSTAPKRARSVQEVLQLANQLIASQRLHSAELGIDRNRWKEAQTLEIKFPQTWLDLCDVIPRLVNGPAREFEPEHLPYLEEHTRCMRQREMHLDPLVADPSGLVECGGTGSGDVYLLDTRSSNMPFDCRVILWNHETLGVDRVWDTVPAFVQELLIWAEMTPSKHRKNP